MSNTIAKLGRRLRLGVIGGGPGSFIGPVHRAAARGSTTTTRSSRRCSPPIPSDRGERGCAIGIAPDRAYGTAEELFAGEKARDDGIDVVAIMTPNDSHYPLCLQALANGLDIICDKPLTTNLHDARDLVSRVNAAGVVFCQTFNYSGFPMVRQAKAMVRDGDLGDVRMIEVEYVQGHNAALTADRARRGEQLAFRSGAGRRVADPRRYRQPRPSPRPLRLLPGPRRGSSPTSPPWFPDGTPMTMPASSSGSRTMRRA